MRMIQQIQTRVDQAPEPGRYPSAVARVCSLLQHERGPKARRTKQRPASSCPALLFGSGKRRRPEEPLPRTEAHSAGRSEPERGSASRFGAQNPV